MAEEDKNDLKVVEQADGTVLVGTHEDPAPADPAENPAPANAEDASGRHDGEDHEDEQAAEGETAEEAEARRQRNRTRRQENKERRKGYIESLKRELASRDAVINDLAGRVATVERQSTGSQMAQIDTAMKEAENVYNHFKTLNQQAIEQANGAAAVDAQEKMFQARMRYQQLNGIKQGMTRQPQQPQPLDPRLKAHAEDFMGKHSWYDPNGGDMDSRMMLNLDKELFQEGWDPKTKEYWEELEARGKKYLSHRFHSAYNPSQQQNGGGKPAKSPVAPSGREDQGGGKPKGYRLSAERVQALKDAGMWEDPAKRNDAIRRFQEFDRQHGGQA